MRFAAAFMFGLALGLVVGRSIKAPVYIQNYIACSLTAEPEEPGSEEDQEL